MTKQTHLTKKVIIKKRRNRLITIYLKLTKMNYY